MFKSLLCSCGLVCTLLGSINPCLSSVADTGYIVSCADTSGNDVSGNSSDDTGTVSNTTIECSCDVDLSTIESYLSSITDNTKTISSAVSSQVEIYFVFSYDCSYDSQYSMYKTLFSFFVYDVNYHYIGSYGMDLDSNNLPTSPDLDNGYILFSDTEITSDEEAMDLFVSSNYDFYYDCNGDFVQFSSDIVYCLNCGHVTHCGYYSQRLCDLYYNNRIVDDNGHYITDYDGNYWTFSSLYSCNNSVLYKGLIKLYWSYKDNLSPLYSYSQYSLPQWQEMYREYIHSVSETDVDGIYSGSLNYENGVFLGITHLIYELSINRLILAYVSAILTVMCVFIGVFVIRNFRKGTMFYGNNRK